MNTVAVVTGMEAMHRLNDEAHLPLTKADRDNAPVNMPTETTTSPQYGTTTLGSKAAD